jgi:Tfp pilus assembly protein PilX
VIALILLIVITLISLASSFTSIFEIKMAGNKRGSTDAFFAADSGIQVVISDIANFDLPGNYDPITNKYPYSKKGANPNPTHAVINIQYDNTQAGP